jgi:hypothetical protein
MSGVSLKMKRVLPAIGLFFAAPLIAEYLPGNLPITMLGTLVVLAPMYGGGAILIRETVRRAGRGWPSIIVLALAYGVLEEGLVTQSLFNPNYLGLNQHLLQPEYIPVFGIGAWWTVFVLTLHAVWSIPVSIAMVEGLSAQSAPRPWLRGPGLALVAILFALGSISIARFTIREDAAHFVASRSQLASTAAIIVALIVLAFRLPQLSGVHGRRSAPLYSTAGLTALIAGSAFLIIPNQWGWWTVCLYLVLDVSVILLIRTWSRGKGWGPRHRLALSGGAALAYAWHAFVETPAVGRPNRAGNAVFAAGLLIALVAAALKTPVEVE